MFSPPRREKSRAGGDSPSHLPKGDCRYILLHPEFQGLRCACVGFALNRSIPVGSTCDCGHLACYHTPDKDAGLVERQELDALKEKIALLEEQLARERRSDRDALVDRLGRLEELVDRTKAETDTELKTMYRGIGGLWHNVGLLNKRMPYYDDRIEGLVDDVQRMDNRLMEVDDASIRVEERVESLENSNSIEQSISRRRRASTPPSTIIDTTTEKDGTEGSQREPGMPLHLVISREPAHVQSFRARVASVGSGSQAWTVHVSFLPTLSQPFPFEKDTAAYKRCLSRGLHQIIVIPDSDDESFRTAVNEAFAEVLQRRPWQPLVARICDVGNLRGLPMLRKLPDYLLGSDYDLDFLRNHCAVVDETGKILDLYIAMSEDTISWAELKDITPVKPGLEASWTYDLYLDGPSSDADGTGGQAQATTEKRPAAGDILPSWSPSLKRNASEISRTPSFGSSTDGEGTRAKVRRQCTGTSVEVVGRRAEAV